MRSLPAFNGSSSAGSEAVRMRLTTRSTLARTQFSRKSPGLPRTESTARNDRFDHPADGARIDGVVLDHIRRGLHSAATAMPHDQDERHAELGDGVFHRSEGGGVCGVAGIADDEELAETAPEQDLRGDAGIGTAHQHAERGLAEGDLDPALTPLHRADRTVGLVEPVALLHQLQRLIGRQVRLLGGRAGRQTEIRHGGGGEGRCAEMAGTAEQAAAAERLRHEVLGPLQFPCEGSHELNRDTHSCGGGALSPWR